MEIIFISQCFSHRNSGDFTHKLETSDLMRKINERVVSKRVIKAIFDSLAAGVF